MATPSPLSTRTQTYTSFQKCKFVKRKLNSEMKIVGIKKQTLKRRAGANIDIRAIKERFKLSCFPLF